MATAKASDVSGISRPRAPITMPHSTPSRRPTGRVRGLVASRWGCLGPERLRTDAHPTAWIFAAPGLARVGRYSIDLTRKRDLTAAPTDFRLPAMGVVEARATLHRGFLIWCVLGPPRRSVRYLEDHRLFRLAETRGSGERAATTPSRAGGRIQLGLDRICARSLDAAIRVQPHRRVRPGQRIGARSVIRSPLDRRRR
jgi:hypothetical protein